jgi:hypothetical protein
MPVSRDFEATVEYDGEDFTIVLRWSESTGWGSRHWDEHHVWVEEVDLPPEVVSDLKQTYTERYGDEEEEDNV